MPTFDPGSVLLAAIAASAGSALVDAAMVRAGWRGGYLAFAIGELVTPAPLAASSIAAMLVLAGGVFWAAAFAGVWSVTGWPIAPLQGALFALAPWALALSRLHQAALPGASRRAGRGRAESAARLLAALTFGALVGALYRPGS